MSITRKQVVEKALSWVGARKGDGWYEGIMEIFNSNSQGYRYDGEGCSEFACACALAFGKEGEDAIFVANWAEGIANKYKKANRFHTDGIPKPGDFCFWNTGSGDIDHVEIVVDATANYIWTVNGNANYSVQRDECSIPRKSYMGWGENLFADDEPVPAPYDFGALLKSSLMEIRLKEGVESPLVKVLQVYLGYWGWYDGDVTGHFGALTKKAVTGWQEKNIELGIYDGEATGEVGPKSWEVILRDLKLNK